MPAMITKRGKKRWLGSIMKDGVRKQKLFPDATKKSKREAQQWEMETLKKLEKELTSMGSLTIAQWVDEYLDYAMQNHCGETYKEKKRVFQRVAVFFGNVEVESLTPAKAMAFLQKEFRSRSGNAANKDRKNLVAAWNWGSRYFEGFPRASDNPFMAVPKFRTEKHPRYVPPKEDFDKVRDISEGQDRLMLDAFLFLAARRKEIFNLKWADIDFHNKKIRLWTQKRQGGTKEADWLPMVPELATGLAKWKEDRPIKTTPYVFVCLASTAFTEAYYGNPFTARQHFMKKLCKKAKVKPFGFHAIRHLTASILYHKGCQLSVIQALLRHKSPTTTNIYLRNIGAEVIRESLEDALSE